MAWLEKGKVKNRLTIFEKKNKEKEMDERDIKRKVWVGYNWVMFIEAYYSKLLYVV